MPQKWGQNFLNQSQYVEQIISTSQLEEDDFVLEIGPGKGILTRALLRKNVQVTAIEIDPKLYQKLLYLREDSEEKTRNSLRLVHEDILKISSQQLTQFHPSPFKVVANLPYNIATPIFFKLLSLRQHLSSITVMVQKEVAERICANVEDGKAYGALSIAADIGFHRQYSFTVPASAFYPPPKVESAVIHLVPKSRVFSPEEEITFLKWTQCVFNQRRKTLLNNLRRCSLSTFAIHKEYLTQLYSQKRAETLTSNEFIELFHKIYSSSLSGEPDTGLLVQKK